MAVVLYALAFATFTLDAFGADPFGATNHETLSAGLAFVALGLALGGAAIPWRRQ